MGQKFPFLGCLCYSSKFSYTNFAIGKEGSSLDNFKFLDIMKQKVFWIPFERRSRLLLLFLMFAVLVQAQSSRVITGTIKDGLGEPLIGVNVTVKGDATLGTISDMNGEFSLKLPLNQKSFTLSFSFIGYRTLEKKVGPNENQLNIQLEEDTEMLDEVVVVGYGTMKRKDVTGAVAHLGSEITETKVATNAVDFLKGNIAGVNISVDNNASGGGTIEVRGPASLTAKTSPLIVLDGSIYYGNISDINPNDIESMDVLKDASSTAVYGSKGSAGVILITTKRGTTEKPVINVSAKVGFATLLDIPDLPTPAQYIQRRSDYWKTIDYFLPSENQHGLGYYDDPYNLPEGVSMEEWAAYDPSFSGDYIETWLTRLQFSNVEIQNYKAGRTVDWRDHGYQTGLRQDYNMSISGKSARTNYYASLGYTNNEGYKVGDVFKTVRARVNLDTDITKWLTVGLNAQFADRSDDGIVVDNGVIDTMSPYASMYNEDGSLKMYPTDDARVVNPLLATNVDDKFYKTQTLTSTIFGKLTLPYGFSFQTNFNVRYGWRKQYYYTSDEKPNIPTGGKAKRDEYSDSEWSVDNMLKWNYTFDDIHNFDVTLLYSAEKYQFWNTIAENSGFIPSGILGWHNLAAGTTPVVSSNDEVQTGNALMARLNYSLMDRYLLTASVRRDGFSAFGVNNPYGTYPAFALGWRMSEESFIKKLKFIDNLKLRFSWGENGNRDIGRYAALSKLTVTDAIENGSHIIGVWTNNLANNNLKWERTQAANLGLDFGLFNGRLNGTLDLYHNKTTDLIVKRSLPTITGYSNVIDNLGQVNNKGIELTLTSTNIYIPKKVNWSTTFIYSANDNTIKHLYGKMVDVLDDAGNVIGQREDDDVQNGWYIGHGIKSIYYYKTIGIWQLGEEEEAAKYGKQPGDPKVLDVDEDGVITEDDKVWLGSRTPRYRMSLRSDLRLFDCIDFSFVLRGEFNFLGEDNLARNEDNRFFDRSNSIWNEYWTPWNPSNEYARLGANCGNPSVLIFKKRDFVKMQNMSLSYTFPKAFLKKYAIENLKVSLSVDNAFVITGWDYYDPENMGTCPRIWTFGVNVTL